MMRTGERSIHNTILKLNNFICVVVYFKYPVYGEPFPWAIIIQKRVNLRRFHNKEEAIRLVKEDGLTRIHVDFAELFYNWKRLHSSIDYYLPEEYECIEMKKAV